MPNLGSWVNRMPTYNLTQPSSTDEESETTMDETELSEDAAKLKERPTLDQLRTLSSMAAELEVEGPSCYAVLPEGHEVQGWTKEDLLELNDHVRHMLHSRRSKFKRSMKGFGQYIRKREFSSLPPASVRT